MSNILTTLYINSKNRTSNSQSSSNFTINLSDLGLRGLKSFVIKNITIPYTFYTTSYKNNDIVGGQKVDFQFGFLTYTLIVPFGNYSDSQLSSYIVNQLNTYSGFGMTFTMTFNYYDNSFTISAPLPFQILWSTQYANQPEYKKLSYVLGFNNTDTISATSHKSNFASNLSGGMNIYLKSSTLTYQNTNFFENKNNTVLCAIPVNAGPGGVIFYTDQQLLVQRNRAMFLNKIDFQLVDEYDNQIDLGTNIDWSMVICIYNELM